MLTAKTVLRLFAVVALGALTPAIVRAAEPAALRVVIVQVTDQDAYVKEIDKAKAMIKRLEIPAQIRIWKARFAGQETGSVAVALEFPNLTELAKGEAKMAADEEYSTWLKNLGKLRKIVSESIYFELKP
jgi:hypothetical protein